MIIAALMIVVLAGGMNGSFAAPMSRVHGWQWEHTWLVWSILGMFVIPASVTIATVPHLGAVYHTAGPVTIASTALYGMLWGAGAVFVWPWDFTRRNRSEFRDDSRYLVCGRYIGSVACPPPRSF